MHRASPGPRCRAPVKDVNPAPRQGGIGLTQCLRRLRDGRDAAQTRGGGAVSWDVARDDEIRCFVTCRIQRGEPNKDRASLASVKLLANAAIILPEVGRIVALKLHGESPGLVRAVVSHGERRLISYW